MSISFTGIAPSQYIGTPYAIPFTLGGPGAICVPLSFNWQSYGAGNSNQNILVPVNLQSGQVRQLLNKQKSVYIDNTGSAVPVYVQCPDTLWTVVCQAFSAGWYPLFTNAYVLNIAAIGFTNTNVASTRVTICNIPPFPYTDVAYQAVLAEFLASPTIGGGASIANIFYAPTGQNYNNGSLSISGGGGKNGAAHGILDQWGRFTGAIIIDDPGSKYTGPPIIIANGGQTIPPVFSGGTVYNNGAMTQFNGTQYQWNNATAFDAPASQWNSATRYGVGAQVNYSNSGNIYISLVANGPSGVPPPNSGAWQLFGQWLSTGTFGWTVGPSNIGQQAQFTSILTPQAQAIVSPGYGVPALGDQTVSFFADVSATGTYQTNLFGTPYASGFIYLTNIDIKLISSTGLTAVDIELTNGTTIALDFTAGNTSSSLVDLQRCNIKLDATQTWGFVCTSISGSSPQAIIQHNLAWTYSQQ